MAQIIGGEAEPRAERGVSRRDLAKIAGFALFAGGYYCITGRSPRQNTAASPNVVDPNTELANLLAANDGRPVVGNALGRYPERAINLACDATNLVVVTYRGTDIVSVGTAWKAELSERADGDVVTLATAQHVLTDHGRHSLDEITGLWVGHPQGRDSFTCVDASNLNLALATQDSSPEPLQDAGIIRMPRRVAPPQLAAAQALRLAAPGEVPPGSELLVTGVPAVFVPQFSSAGMESTPWYAQVMGPRLRSEIPRGCFGLDGLCADGVSGASAVGPAGQVVGMVIDYVSRDPHTTVAARTDSLQRLAS